MGARTDAETRATCESCGSVDELAPVRRVYVTPESWDTPGKVELAEIEAWCFVCRTHYPHQELDDSGAPVEGHELGWPVEAPPTDG